MVATARRLEPLKEIAAIAPNQVIPLAMDEYSDVLGVTREFMRLVSGKQAGDPAKAARALSQVLSSEEVPLRLVLGDEAVDAIRTHSAELFSSLRT